MPDIESLILVDLYQTPVLKRLLGRPQRWRWRALNGNNFRVLAISSEAYTNESDCRDAIYALFGNRSDVYLRQAGIGNRPLRLVVPPRPGSE